VIDELSWDAGLDSVSDLFGQCALMLGTMRGPGDFVLSGHRMDAAAIALLAGPLANPQDNPWVAAAPALALRRPARVDDIGGQELLEGSRVWQQFYRGFGYSHAMGSVLERQSDHIDIMMLARGGDSFANGDVANFSPLIAHVARSFRVRRQMQHMRAHAEDLAAALDHLERGVIITGPEGQLRFANRAADRLLTTGDGIDATAGRVRATQTRSAKDLSEMIYRGARTGIGQDTVAVDAVSIERSDNPNPIAVVAEPLAPGHHEGLGLGRREGTILFIGDSTNVPLSVGRIAAVYGLTGAEADITASIAAGTSVASAAQARGISENTAKTHLKSVYEKIGIQRQSQLVRRVMADLGGLVTVGAPSE